MEGSISATAVMTTLWGLVLILGGAWGKAILEQLRGINDKLGGVITASAVHDSRLDSVEHRVHDLESLNREKAK